MTRLHYLKLRSQSAADTARCKSSGGCKFPLGGLTHVLLPTEALTARSSANRSKRLLHVHVITGWCQPQQTVRAVACKHVAAFVEGYTFEQADKRTHGAGSSNCALPLRIPPVGSERYRRSCLARGGDATDGGRSRKISARRSRRSIKLLARTTTEGGDRPQFRCVLRRARSHTDSM